MWGGARFPEISIPLGGKLTHSLSRGQYTFSGNLVYEFKRIVGNPICSDQLKNIIKRYQNRDMDTTWISCDVVNPITVLAATVSSLIARQWVKSQTQ